MEWFTRWRSWPLFSTQRPLLRCILRPHPGSLLHRTRVAGQPGDCLGQSGKSFRISLPHWPFLPTNNHNWNWRVRIIYELLPNKTLWLRVNKWLIHELSPKISIEWVGGSSPKSSIERVVSTENFNWVGGGSSLKFSINWAVSTKNFNRVDGHHWNFQSIG